MIEARTLLCDHQSDPVGIGTDPPLLSWTPTDASTGCQVVVAMDEADAAAGRGTVWDSERVSTARCQLTYTGPRPEVGVRYWWTVRLWDGDGVAGPVSQPARFEYGPGGDDWQAGWFGFGSGWAGQALLARTTIEVGADVTSARAYVASLGWHQLRLNGAPVDDRVLEPAPTATSVRVPCSTYVLGGGLQPGPNRLGLVLAGGWTGQRQASVQVHLDHADGRREVIAGSDRTWQLAPAPVVASSPYEGEVYDARLRRVGWDTPAGEQPMVAEPADADDPWAPLFGTAGSRVRGWTAAQHVDPPAGRIRPLPMPVARVTEDYPPVAVAEPRPGVWVVDAGANGAGWLRIRLHDCPRGRRVILRYAESLAADGTVDQENLRDARASDVYVCGGGPVETYEPTLTSHGFRYVQVDGAAHAPALDDIRVRRARTDLPARSAFDSDPLLERIYAAAVRTEASNTLGVLTDCPQRAERHGWLNDLTNRLDTAVLAHDLAPLLTKVLDDIADAQRPDGAIPDTVPFRWGHPVGDPVCLAPLLIPRLLERHWGDSRANHRAYPVARRWLTHLLGRCEDGVLGYTHWGDWAESKECAHERDRASGVAPRLPETDPPAGEPVSRRTPGALVSTACLAGGLRMLAELAVRVGDHAGADEARAQAAAVTRAFNAAFRDPDTGNYGTGSQGSLACALGFGLVPAEDVDGTVELLAAEVARHGHLTTGNIATKYVLELLSDHGHHQQALDLARRVEYPSWGYMINRGATTIWERWEELTGGGMNSHNHGMLASIGSWLVTRHAGLAVADDAVGADRWLISIPAGVDDDHAGASLNTIRGRAAVRWQRNAGRLAVEVMLPVGASGRLRLPVPVERAGAGDWQPVGRAACERLVTGSAELSVELGDRT